MVPGFTDTECRMAEFRYRELLAEVDRQRHIDAAIPVSASQVHVTEMIQRYIGAVREQVRAILPAMRTKEATDAASAPGTLAVN